MKKQFSDKKLLLINETFIIDHSILDKWLEWMNTKMIPFLKNMDYISDIVFSMIHTEYNPDGVNFALQFQIDKNMVNDLQKNQHYIDLRNELMSNFKDMYASFTTTMTVIK